MGIERNPELNEINIAQETQNSELNLSQIEEIANSLSVEDIEKFESDNTFVDDNQIKDEIAASFTTEDIERFESQFDEVEPETEVEKETQFASTNEANLIESKEADEVESKFSAENFKSENSYDAYARENYPELNDLKSKCIYDVQSMGTPSEQIDRSPKGEYQPEERNYIKDIRDNVDAPNKNLVMQKVIGVDTGDIEKDLGKYLNPQTPSGEAQVYGFVAKAEDAAPFTRTPQDCYDNLRLDYSGTQYEAPNQPVYAIRFTDGENYGIPYSEEFGGEEFGLSPFTGNGFVSSKDVTIPEYTVIKDVEGNGAIVTDGEIYRINPDGSEKAVAYYNKQDRCFDLLCEEENK